MNITLTESAAFGVGFKLNKEAGIAYGVAVCGAVSANGRDYPDHVRDRDKHVYEGASCFLDHGGGERKVREWFGTLKNTRTRLSDKKTIADLHYPKTSQFTAEFEERAERFPGSFGFSHVAECRTKRQGGRDVIEAITRVHSVDLVARPATNAGLYESVGKKPVRLMEQAARWCIGQRDTRRINVFLEAVAAAGDETTDSKLADMVTSAEFDAMADALGKVLDKFKKRLLSADQYKAAVLEVLDRLGHAAPGLNESHVPTEGAAFVRWLKGQPSPEETRRFVASIQYPTVRYASTQAAEVIRIPTAPGTVPTDGKAFFEWLKWGR